MLLASTWKRKHSTKAHVRRFADLIGAEVTPARQRAYYLAHAKLWSVERLGEVLLNQLRKRRVVHAHIPSYASFLRGAPSHVKISAFVKIRLA